MQRQENQLIFSPSDLVTYLEGDFASWMDRLYAERQTGQTTAIDQAHASHAPLLAIRPDESDEEMQLVAQKGQEHEQEFLQHLIEEGREVVQIPQGQNAAGLTVDAMKAGKEIIYQARLQDETFMGYTDFLFRCEGRSNFGNYYYSPLDTKLAQSAKPYFIIQLCAYADMLETVQGVRPPYFEFVLGKGKSNNSGEYSRQRFQTDSFFHYYRRFRQSFLEFQQNFDPAQMPDPGLEHDFGRWSTQALAILESSDHLSRVARITRNQIKRLCAGGIETMSALAVTTQTRIPKIKDDTFDQLKTQAKLQIESRGLDKPKYLIVSPQSDDPRRGLALLPPPSEHDIFFDMEGFPLVENGLEYLFGAIAIENSKPCFHDWWAHDTVQEKAAFEEFIDWAHARWKQNPSMHIYHYAAYEPAAMKRLMGQYATRENEVDDLLRNQVFVDLYTVVRQGLIVGTDGYSLKNIEHLYMTPRAGEVKTAGGSVVAYHKWIISGESQAWQSSTILTEIREYNRVDCQSTLDLRNWLLEIQSQSGIAYLGHRSSADSNGDKESTPTSNPSKLLAEKLHAQIQSGTEVDEERGRIQTLLAHLLEFHWREAKPVFWRKFHRQELTEEDLANDFDCLSALERTKLPPRLDKRSTVYQYTFNPDQDTKLQKESECFLAHDISVKTTIASIDTEMGLIELKFGPKASVPPQGLSLIPNEYVSADCIAAAVLRYAQSWSNGACASDAVDHLLRRQAPRINDHHGGPLVSETQELLPQIVDLACRLDKSTLCIQGPPGTGKTYTAAAIIVALLRKKLRIAITANSHKAILNLMHAVHEATSREKVTGRLIKVGTDHDDPLVQSGEIVLVKSSGIISEIAEGAVVVGGTAWALSRQELAQQFDYLVVEEAGQFSLANLVGTGQSASNLILVGDQMQLAQPIQGSHPKPSGMSCLEYLLNGCATIAADFGVFLDVTRRMHRDVCGFISQAVYEGRLKSHPCTDKQRIAMPNSPGRVTRATGLLFVPVQHDGNTQYSEEEVDVIGELVGSLIGRNVVSGNGQEHKLTIDDILVVAPYNMQVRKLEQRLGAKSRVGSVDRFQGLEAPVVIVSMCASSLEECPRGAEFLLSPNRLNVAISRAKSLAIVVGSPNLMTARCSTVAQMELVNLFCWLSDYSERNS